LVPARNGQPPVVKLDDSYKLVDAIEHLGTPSLANCDEVTIAGPLTFENGTVLRGKVAFSAPSGDPKVVRSGTYADGEFPL
jgi:hypothetical protein